MWSYGSSGGVFRKAMPMTRSSRTTADAFLPLHPLEFHILVALLEGRRHGYAIVKEIESLSQGSDRLFPANLYRRIRRLRDDGLLRPSGEDVSEGGPPRRYFELTELGRHVAALEAHRLRSLVELADRAGLSAFPLTEIGGGS